MSFSRCTEKVPAGLTFTVVDLSTITGLPKGLYPAEAPYGGALCWRTEIRTIRETGVGTYSLLVLTSLNSDGSPVSQKEVRLKDWEPWIEKWTLQIKVPQFIDCDSEGWCKRCDGSYCTNCYGKWNVLEHLPGRLSSEQLNQEFIFWIGQTREKLIPFEDADYGYLEAQRLIYQDKAGKVQALKQMLENGPNFLSSELQALRDQRAQEKLNFDVRTEELLAERTKTISAELQQAQVFLTQTEAAVRIYSGLEEFFVTEERALQQERERREQRAMEEKEERAQQTLRALEAQRVALDQQILALTAAKKS